jgi:hypothetical protein
MHNLAGHLSSEAKENLINLLTYLKEETGYPEAVKQLDSTKLTDNTYDF